MAFCFTILGVLCLTVNQTIIKYLLEATDYWTVFSYVRMGSFLAVVPLLPIVVSDVQAIRSERNGEEVASHREFDLNPEAYPFHRRIVYDADANWKLWYDNNVECYHCPRIHRESFR